MTRVQYKVIIKLSDLVQPLGDRASQHIIEQGGTWQKRGKKNSSNKQDLND